MVDTINDDITAKLQAALDLGMDDERIKKCTSKLRDQLIEEVDALEYDIKDRMAQDLVSFITDMAKKTVTAILEGNDDQMRRYLGCERGAWTGRSDGCVWGRKREIDEWHSVIQGTLFEQGSIKLRRDIVAAHRDLITDERVKDLEDQVMSLVAQVNNQKDIIKKLRGEGSERF